MRIDRVSYQKIFPTGMAYLNHKIGVEIQVDDNDDPDTVFQYAKQKVEQWNIESNPGMAVAMEYSATPEHPMNVTQVEKTPKEQAIDSQIEAISGCTSLKSLEIFKKLVERENNPRLNEAYVSKHKELFNLLPNG